MALLSAPGVIQPSHVISESPGFALGAVAGFVSMLVGRLTAVIERIRHLSDIGDAESARARLKSDLPRLRRRGDLLNNIYMAERAGA